MLGTLEWTLGIALAAGQAGETPLPPALQEVPFDLDEAESIVIRERLARAAHGVAANFVQLSIERLVTPELVVSEEAGGFIVGPEGHVATLGSTLAHAARVAVHFSNTPQLRPRRARVIGIDEATDVGVLSIGPIALERLALEALEAAAAAGALRFVVTVCGDVDEPESSVMLGYMHETLAQPMVMQRRFPRLLQVTLARRPPCAGGLVTLQDGRVAGLALPVQWAAAGADRTAMLAIPADVVGRGVAAVLAAAPESRLADPPSLPPRAWIGFGVTELDEPEFLAHLDVPGALVVREVFEESPALAAGLEPRDLLLRWDGRPLARVEDLHAELAKVAPGSTIELDCMRRPLERRRVKLTLAGW
jgi:serine protease Do